PPCSRAGSNSTTRPSRIACSLRSTALSLKPFRSSLCQNSHACVLGIACVRIRPGSSKAFSQKNGGLTTTKQERLADTILRAQPERAYLVAVEQDQDESLCSVEDSLQELGTLARTAGAQVVGSMIQRLRHPDSTTYLGKGKV